MQNYHSLIKASLLAAVLIACGCESNAGSNSPDEECTGACDAECTDACTIDSKRCSNDGVEVCAKLEDGCTNWKLDSKCETGTHCNEDSFTCEDDEVTQECEESCKEGDRRCGFHGIEMCQKVDDKCFGWEIETLCEGDTICAPDKFECIAEEETDPPIVCAEPCTENTKRCGENGVEICTQQESGCIEWGTDKICDAGTHCDEEQLDCIAGCTETCEQGKSKRCNEDNELEECKPNANGCAEWSVIKECDNLTCSSEKGDCIKTCTPACTKGEKKCNGNGVATCIDPSNDGCTIWDAPAPCASNQSCEAATCVNKCTSNCNKEGATESTWTSLKTCQKTADGCLQWQQTATCKKGEKLSGGKCVKVCGSDCASFSVFLLPDPQEYTRFVNDAGVKSPSKVDDLPNTDIFADQLEWIDNRKTNPEFNIKAVIHLGDITDTNDKSAWRLVDNTYKKYLDDKNPDLPYILAPGNHDFYDCKKGNQSTIKTDCSYKRASNFSEFFNADRFKGRKWFGGFFGSTNS
ncbi:MAG: metallophosphoesterase, partial [Proteobacteria bacterium]|nr:metallophosphoesterase [Pseudomonadota bacterium]